MPWSTRRKRSFIQNERPFGQNSQNSSQNTSKNLDEGSPLDSSPFQLESPLESTPKQSGEPLSQSLEPTQKVLNSQSLDQSGFDDNSNDFVLPTQIVESTQITANISPLHSQEDANYDMLPTQIVPSSQNDLSSPQSPEDNNSLLPTQIVANTSPTRGYQEDEEEYLESTQPQPGSNPFPPTQIVFSPEDDPMVAASQDVDACVTIRSPNKRPRKSPPSDTEDNQHDKSVEIVSSKTLMTHQKNSVPPANESPTLQCGICLEDVIDRGEMDSGCGHLFCFQCILEWSRVTNLCALCKKEFKSLTRINVKDHTRAETLQVTPKKQRVHDDEEYDYDDDDESDSFSEASDIDPDVYDVNDFYDADYHPPVHDNTSPVTSRRRTRSTRTRSRIRTPPRQESPVISNTQLVVSQANQVTPPRGTVWVPPVMGYSPVSTPPLTPVHPRYSPFRLPLGALPSPIPSRFPSNSLDTSLVSTPQAKNATPPETPSPILSPEIISTHKSRNLEPPTTISPTVSPISSRRQASTPSPSPSPVDTSTDILSFDFRSTRSNNPTPNRTTSTLNNNNNNNRSNNSNNNNNQDASAFSLQPVKQPGRLTVKSGSFPASIMRTQSTHQPPKENEKVLKKVWKEFDNIMKKKGDEKKSEATKSQLKKVPSDPTKKGPPKVFDLNTIRFTKKDK